MLENLEKYKMILGSASPRRKELLSGLGIAFEVKTIEVNESYPSSLGGMEIPCYLAEKKANAHKLNDNDLLITADTIVWLEGQVYGKPKDKNDARRILKSLSGKTHQVISGVCVRTPKKQKTFSVVSDVRFGTLKNSEIDYYIENFNPYDKAGAYGVQEWIGYVAVERIEGSFYNIMGLPVQRLYTVLKEF